MTVAETPAWVISPYLASMSLVYAWAPDAAYSNGTMAQWARSHRINTARYPAGMAAYWNWEAPSGMMGVSSLDPAAPPPVRQNYLLSSKKRLFSKLFACGDPPFVFIKTGSGQTREETLHERVMVVCRRQQRNGCLWQSTSPCARPPACGNIYI